MGSFNCYTALTNVEHDYDINILGNRPFQVSANHTEISLIACPQITFGSIRDENNIVYHPHGPNMVNIADAGDSICYYGTAVDEETRTGQRYQMCDSATIATRIWHEILFDGSGQNATIFFPDCVESMRRMSALVRPEDTVNWKRARVVLTLRSELYVSDTDKFAEQVICGEDVSSVQELEISRVPTREELLFRVFDDGRSGNSVAKDVCMVYRQSSPQRYRKDLFMACDLQGIFCSGGYSHPYLDVPKRWNIVNDVTWPSYNGELAEPLPANVLVGGEGHADNGDSLTS